jgi:hypothetical protein
MGIIYKKVFFGDWNWIELAQDHITYGVLELTALILRRQLSVTLAFQNTNKPSVIIT